MLHYSASYYCTTLYNNVINSYHYSVYYILYIIVQCIILHDNILLYAIVVSASAPHFSALRAYLWVLTWAIS